MRTSVLTSRFYKVLPFDPNLPCSFHPLTAGLCVCLVLRYPSRHRAGANPPFHTRSRCVHQEAGGHAASHLSPSLFSSPWPFLLSGGRHAGPLGADLCLGHMWLSVGTPQSKCEGPALPSCSLPLTLAVSEGLAGGRVHSQPAAPLGLPHRNSVLGQTSGRRHMQAVAENVLQSGHRNFSHSRGPSYGVTWPH